MGMKAKLIKRDSDYWLHNEAGETIATSWGVVDGKKLSKQNCDEIFGVIDVEEIADRHTFGQRNHEWKAYIAGFNKNAELNKDKVFTKEEVHKLLRLVHILPNFELEQFEDENNVLQIDTFISHHIQQPTEIEVEIVMGDSIGISDLYTPDNKPKLDSEGCLILKKR